jgi:hypothetical protein
MTRRTTTSHVLPWTMMALLVVGAASAGAASPAPQCVQGCNDRRAACLEDVRGRRLRARAACAADPSRVRSCRRQANRALGAARAACRKARAACGSCCRASGQPCSDLGLVTDAAHGTSALIGEAGGSLTTTDLDGTTYEFVVPAGALVSEQTIGMSPLAGVANLPLSGSLVAGVQFAPDGLAFLVPATLVVTLPDAVDPTGIVGFGFRRAGEGMHLQPSTSGGRTLTFAVTHFSGIGATRGTKDDIAALVSSLLPDGVGATVSSEFAENLYTSQIAQLMAQDVRDPAAYQAVLKEWVRVSLRLTLAATQLETGIDQALLEYLGWKSAIGSVSAFLGVDVATGMAREVEEMGRAMARVLFAVGFVSANLRCAEAPSIAGSNISAADLVRVQLRAANDAVAWFRILEGLGLAPLAIGSPTLTTVLNALCVDVKPFDARLIPDDPKPGDATELRVRAGLTFRNLAGATTGIVFDAPVGILATASGVEEAIPAGRTDGHGIFSAATHREGDAPIALTVRGCIDDPAFPLLRAVCAGAVFEAPSTTTTSTSSTTSTTAFGNTSTTVPGIGSDTLSGTIDVTFDGAAGAFGQVPANGHLTAFVRVHVEPDGTIRVLEASGSGSRDTGPTVDRYGCSDDQGQHVTEIETRTHTVASVAGGSFVNSPFDSDRLDTELNLTGPVTITIADVADFSTCPVSRRLQTDNFPDGSVAPALWGRNLAGNRVFAPGGLALIDFNGEGTVFFLHYVVRGQLVAEF